MREKRLSKDRTYFGVGVSSRSTHFYRAIDYTIRDCAMPLLHEATNEHC
jgi:hypothetical protein